MKLHHVLPFFLMATAVQAQKANLPKLRDVGTAASDNIQALVDGSTAMLPSGNSYGLKGTPYLDSRWLNTRLKLTNDVTLEPVLFKYDILTQRLLVRPPKNLNDSIQLNDNSVAGFTIDMPAGKQPAYQRHFRRFLEAPTVDQQVGYVEIIYEGAYSLLKRYTKRIVKANYQGAYTSGEHYDQVDDNSQYYLLRPDKVLVPVKLTTKMIQAAAPELAVALKANPAAYKAKTDAEWAAVLAAAEAAK